MCPGVLVLGRCPLSLVRLCAYLGRTHAAQLWSSVLLLLLWLPCRGGMWGSSLGCGASKTGTDRSAKPCPAHWCSGSEALPGLEQAEQQRLWVTAAGAPTGGVATLATSDTEEGMVPPSPFLRGWFPPPLPL